MFFPSQKVQLILKSSPKECRLFKDADQNIPLLYAVEVGNHGLSKELLTEYQKEQLEARKNGNGDGAIHISAKRRDLEMIKHLIERGCNINMKNVSFFYQISIEISKYLKQKGFQ